MQNSYSPPGASRLPSLLPKRTTGGSFEQIMNNGPALPSFMSAQPSGAVPSLQPYACTLCKRRKVKCDRVRPCQGCVRLRARCEFQPPAAPRRRRKRRDGSESTTPSIDESSTKAISSYRSHAALQPAVVSPYPASGEPSLQELKEKVARYESLLRKTLPTRTIESLSKESGEYITGHLWHAISDEVPQSKDSINAQPRLHQSDESALNDAEDPVAGEQILFNPRANVQESHNSQPSKAQIEKLWAVFLERVHPLLMILHAPSMQVQIKKAVDNVTSVPNPTRAVLFAALSCAVASLDSGECQTILSEDQQTLLSSYHALTQDSLTKSRFLKRTDLAVLQAYVLHLISMRRFSDPRTIWALVAVALRLAQRLSLHRDPSELANLSPFEAEIRRRLWWQLLMLDGVMSEQVGAGRALDAPYALAVRPPLNINDADLDPQMTSAPLERTGATEMIFVLERWCVGSFMHRPDEGAILGSKTATLAEKDAVVDALESRLQDNFLRYADPIQPLHMMITGLARAAICKLRLLAHHPRQYTHRPNNDNQGTRAVLPATERALLFDLSLRLLQYDNLAHTHPSMQPFLWHVTVHLQYHALIYLLAELRATGGSSLGGVHESATAWREIGVLMGHRPEIAEGGNALRVAVGRLALGAWDRWERDGGTGDGVGEGQVPHFVTRLRERKRAREANASPVPPPASDAVDDGESGVRSNTAAFDPAPPSAIDGVDMDLDFNLEAMDWGEWDALLLADSQQQQQEYETPPDDFLVNDDSFQMEL